MIEMPNVNGIEPDFIAAANEIGLPTIDPNTPHNLGVFRIQQTSAHGVRNAPYLSLIRPIRNRPTLTIKKFSTVTKVQIQKQINDPRALNIISLVQLFCRMESR